MSEIYSELETLSFKGVNFSEKYRMGLLKAKAPYNSEFMQVMIWHNACNFRASDSVTRRIATVQHLFESYIYSVPQQHFIWDLGWGTPKALPKGHKQRQIWLNLQFYSQTKSAFAVTLKERHVDITLFIKNKPVEVISSLLSLACSVLFEITTYRAFLADALYLFCLYRWAQLQIPPSVYFGFGANIKHVS